MRQYGDVPPWLAALNTPAVSATAGLGTAGGAAVQTEDSGGFGNVLVSVGKGFSATWSVALTFPKTPPALFVAGDDAFGPITQTTVGNVVTLSGTQATFALLGKPYQLHYEWSTSL